MQQQRQQAAVLSNHIYIVNVYKLPSNKKVVCFFHAALLFLTKPTLLEAIQNDSLMTLPTVTTSAVNTFFPESNKMQKGVMENIKQGIMSTKEHQHYVNITSGICSPQGCVIITDQTGWFPVIR
jgi:hypothetical protein